MQNRPLELIIKELIANEEIQQLQQEMQSKTLLGRDVQGRNLLFLAASKEFERYFPICEKLIELSERQAPNSPGYKLWLQSSNDGNTPLHNAALSGNMKIVELLLEKIMCENNSQEIINQINQNGDTALHHAFSAKSIAIILMLIKKGADLSIHNEQKVTPGMLLCRLTDEQQLNLFSQFDETHEIDATHKKIILKSYRQTLIENSTLVDFEKIKKIYFRFAGQVSLQNRLLAGLEFDKNVPVADIKKRKHPVGGRTYYTHKQKDGIEYNIDDLLKRMPLYAQRVLSAKKAAKFIETVAQEERNINRKFNYKRLDEDRRTLGAKIADCQNFLTDLGGRPKHTQPKAITFSNCQQCLVTAFIPAIVYVALLTWLSTESALHERHRVYHRARCIEQTGNDTASLHYDPVRNSTYCILTEGPYTNGAISVGAILGFTAIMACIVAVARASCYESDITINYSKAKEIYVDRDEWKNLRKELQNILKKMKIVDKNEKTINLTGNKAKPTADNVQKLASILAELDHEKIRITKLINIFGRLENILDTIKREMMASNQSFSPAFFQAKNDKVIDMLIIDKQEDKQANTLEMV